MTVINLVPFVVEAVRVAMPLVLLTSSVAAWRISSFLFGCGGLWRFVAVCGGLRWFVAVCAAVCGLKLDGFDGSWAP